MNETQTCIEPSLSEDDLSDLLWLVDNYGDKLTEVADYITSKDVARLAKTLETMLNCLG
jgi:enolase